MSTKKTESVFYECPNHCEDPSFSLRVSFDGYILLTDEGEEMERNIIDYTPTDEVRCRECGEAAVVRRKVTTTTVEIVDFEVSL